MKMVIEGIFETISKSVLKLTKYRLKIFVILIQLTFIKEIFGFNVAPKATYVKSLGNQESNSYFGYSVGLLRNGNGKNCLLVGAPLANSSGSPSVKQPGAFYKCLIDKPDKECQEIYLDKSKNLEQSSQEAKRPFRNNSWTGAAFDIDDEGNVLICAPRWKNAYYLKEYRIPGMCYLIGQDLKNNSALSIDPLLNKDYQTYNSRGGSVYYYAQGQQGMAVHFTKNSDLLLGTPGLLNWQGSVAKLIRQPKVPPGGINRREASFIYSKKIIPNPIRITNIHDNDYFGYSLTSGKFSGKNNQMSYVGGAPRGASSNGMVLIFYMKEYDRNPLRITDLKEGRQLGEYFGASVAAPDLNGDGLSDLVVGAPLHSAEGLYDIGCIYVYNSLENVGELETNGIQLFGDISQGARFGLALGTPGDLDNDGYEDFLVGAPYENEDESKGPSGAVYVFMGSRNGVRQMYLQKLMPEKVSRSVTLKGFGVSFSRPLDVDNNSYPDFAVGSFLSDTVVLMSTRPVITARGELSANPSKLSLDKNFFTLTTCLSYVGEVFKKIAFMGRVFLNQESESGEILASFIDPESTERSVEFLVPNNEKNCQEFQVKLKLNKSDARNPVKVRMDFELRDIGNEGPETPVMSPYTSFPPSLVLSFITGCKDDFCQSDLVSTVRIEDFECIAGLNSKIVIGKASKIVLKVETLNKREPAFLPNITINIPKPIVVLPSMRDCSPESDTQTTSLVCQLKNPLKENETDIISLDLDLSNLDDSTPDIKIDVSSNSATDVEVKPDDNNHILHLSVEKDASISVSGYSEPEQIIYERISEDMVKSNQTAAVIKSRHLVFNSKSRVCSVGESNIQMMLHDPKASNDSVETVNDRRSLSLSTLSCLKGRWGYVNCSKIKCNLGPWKKANDVAQLSINFKVNFTKIGGVISASEGFNLLSFVKAVVSTYENVSQPNGQLINVGEIQTFFVPGSLPAEQLALWIYLVAVLCGLLLLLIIAFILYKVSSTNISFCQYLE
ncbi:Integrin alpha-9 [Armadillidium nasatum]|uniref:Integrin alpha-9 n=1 Tax=Armadillidium nasatum TaxID=96803 RepID=A0A5N5TAY0_9CRUS|nr:Integrin alpha-9 [Armadillidium nasatum]